MSAPKVMFLGLDAFDPGIARQLAAGGVLPNIRTLFQRGGSARVINPVGLYVGALWVTFATGQRADKHGFHCWLEVSPETYEHNFTKPPQMTNPFWHRLGDQGRRVAVVDVPHSRIEGPVNGIQTVEWGSHDRHFGFTTWPPMLGPDIESQFGLHPILGIDAHDVREFAPDDYVLREGKYRTPDEDRGMAAGLAAGASTKAQISRHLLKLESWDLFLAVFGESHSIGHQQWHLHDPTHPRYDAKAREATGGDPLVKIYKELDRGVGELLAEIEDHTVVLTLFSHGMGPHYDGSHLLDELLTRIDAFNRASQRFAPGRALRSAVAQVPLRLRQQAVARAVPFLRHRAASQALPSAAVYALSAQRAAQRYFMEPNNTVVGGVRFNVIGRESAGLVAPDEVRELAVSLADDLQSVVNLANGRPVVKDIAMASDHFSRSPGDTMPDMFVFWDNSASIETVWSPKTGTVHGPYDDWRTGDHRDTGLLLASGPNIPSGVLPDIALEDFAPTIASLLGVSLDGVDGKSAAWSAA